MIDRRMKISRLLDVLQTVFTSQKMRVRNDLLWLIIIELIIIYVGVLQHNFRPFNLIRYLCKYVYVTIPLFVKGICLFRIRLWFFVSGCFVGLYLITLYNALLGLCFVNTCISYKTVTPFINLLKLLLKFLTFNYS